MTRTWSVVGLAMAVAAALAAAAAQAAEPLRFYTDLGLCHDEALEQKRAAVVVFYDHGMNRIEAEALISRLKTSPRMQAISGLALWCRGDVTTSPVPLNFAKALRIAAYPSISVLRPEWSRIYEEARVVPSGMPETAIEAALDQSIRKVQASEPPPWAPPKHY